MSRDCYLTFCPIAKACDVLEPRWTIPILCEIFGGQSRFNEIRRFLPTLSPTLLSRRLKEMEANGLIVRIEKGRDIAYLPTPMAEELKPVMRELGRWAHRHIDRDVTLEHLDARVLMWNIWQKANIAAMPPARQWVIRFAFPEAPPDDRTYWLVARHGDPAELCTVDPGQDVDLFVTADLRAMTQAFLGYTALSSEIARGAIQLVGDRRLSGSFADWVATSSLAAA
jgi:DNA-binding HxlR family transcriptional regulator